MISASIISPILRVTTPILLMQNLLDYLLENGTTDGCDGELMIPSPERHELTHKQFYMDLQRRYK